MFLTARVDGKKGGSGRDFPWIVREPDKKLTQVRLLDSGGCVLRCEPLAGSLLALRPFGTLFRDFERDDSDLAGPFDAGAVKLVVVEASDFIFTGAATYPGFLPRFTLGCHGKCF